MSGSLEQAAGQVNCGTLPFLFWGRQWSPVQKVGDHGRSKWFFIGDIHGDFFALHHLLEEVHKEPDSYVCFLGDLVDRGPHGVECFARLLEFANERFSLAGSPRVVWILGNHDEGILFRPNAEKKFLSSVEPAEFVDYLNGELPTALTSEELVKWGQLFVDVCARLPRALIFESGLMAAHGGIPLEDRWPFLKTFEALQHQRCLGDFTWTRATRAPFKKGWKFDAPRRAYSSSFEFGYRDFHGFCNAVAGLFKVRGLVRGHDHVAGGHETPAEYAESPLLTINGFGFNYLSNSYALYRNSLAIAVSGGGEMPKVVEVSFSHESLEEFIRSEKLIPPDPSGESRAPASVSPNPVGENNP
jgi:UDP-2,3-diacylglucosamine pyrophosphatase LpxH